MILVAFDFDGTIVDTESAELAAWTQIASTYSAPWIISDVHKGITHGPQHDTHDLCVRVGESCGVPASIVFHAYRIALLQSPHIRLLRPGIVEALLMCRDHGAIPVICSSSSYGWIGSFLREFNILDHVSLVMTSDTWEAHWTKRDAYDSLKNHLFQVKPHRTIAVEDSFKGWNHARESGWETIAFPNPITAGDFKQIAEHVAWNKDELCSLLVEAINWEHLD